MKRIKLVFDIDGVIAGTEPVDRDTKLYFLRQGAIIQIASFTHYVYPGMIELFKKIFQYPHVSVAFFSAGTKKRNEEFVEKFLKRCLGEEEYNKIRDSVKICSADDMSPNTVEK